MSFPGGRPGREARREPVWKDHEASDVQRLRRWELSTSLLRNTGQGSFDNFVLQIEGKFLHTFSKSQDESKA